MTKNKPKKPRLNVRLLRRVQRYILEEPRRLNMSEVLVKNLKPDRAISFFYETGCFSNRRTLTPEEFPPCGTVGCIAGNALLLSGKPMRGYVTNMNTAGKLLGLPPLKHEWDRHALFFPDEWPGRYLRDYTSRTTPRGRARVVSRVIDNFIATKGWPEKQKQ